LMEGPESGVVGGRQAADAESVLNVTNNTITIRSVIQDGCIGAFPE